ncbi:3-hydroxyacyl-CoA dehydrogenase [Roseinatronobacter thiooxidans]|uniref:3-hydroxyacyl-CoA dehydrogenase n=1 Tax=Roseinatronobacter thiooxidans TaxID=121821 RepID=A0A2W7R4I0_9RHOB|nr:3-hydroxyacyl-CoA dehydrogenase NAD-binding domain-containing protein [Roseinatronobacter thiooxidans]PZX45595.1 3-hydroxyacyl-CoA dehydrogenase [Roseinatronobacter thiooxidans]
MTETPVRYSREGDVALICIDNPPVNAIGQAVRTGLVASIDAFAGDPAAKIAVLYCAGRTFVAGADIREFGKPPQAPFLPDVIGKLEALDKPVLCVMHGTALGGGLELALGAHYRLGVPGLKIGLPETSLGILPGAGGTQRLPRLTGLEAALEMITSARHVPAKEALALGVIDGLADAGQDPLTAGLAHAHDLLAKGAGPRRICDMPAPSIAPDQLRDMRTRTAKRFAGQIAQLTAIDAAVGGAALPFRDGMQHERALFQTLMESPQRAALVHAFLAERKVAQLPELAGIAPRAFAQIGVVGGGRMGSGIAISALLAGLDVTLVERDAQAAAQAHQNVAQTLADSVKRGKLTDEGRARILAHQFRAADSYAALSDRDVVIEAVFEDMDIKREVFTQLDQHCKQGAILATNTSYLDIPQIAAMTSRPADVLGLHFFSPAHIMRLLEIVVPDKTGADVVATGFAFGKKLGKVSVRAGVCDGFIGNRILQVYRAVSDHMVLAGASPYAVDRAVTEFGFPMGPYAVQDLAGLDIGFMTRQRKAASRDPREFVARWADVMHARGWHGRKTGQGYYSYDADHPKGRPSPEVEEIIADERRAHGVTPREFSADEIVARYMAAMVNESARVVGEGIAARPLDVDVTLLHGYGFPRWRGGPMHWADAQGLGALLSQIEGFAREDAFFWQPAPLLQQLVRENLSFASLNS